jgi:hypothetical protein
MAHGDFSHFDPDTSVGSPILPCHRNKKSKGASPYWIEIEMVDEDNNPCPGEKYSVCCPDGSVKTGTLNRLGFCRIETDQPGTCQVSFPDLDKNSWEPST